MLRWRSRCAVVESAANSGLNPGGRAVEDGGHVGNASVPAVRALETGEPVDRLDAGTIASRTRSVFERYAIERAILFGSFATGRHSRRSLLHHPLRWSFRKHKSSTDYRGLELCSALLQASEEDSGWYPDIPRRKAGGTEVNQWAEQGVAPAGNSAALHCRP